MPINTDAYGRLVKSLLEEPEPLRARIPPAPFRLENPAILEPPPKQASDAPRAAAGGGRKVRQEADAAALEQQLGLPSGSVPRKTGTSPWLSLTQAGQAHASNLQRHRAQTIDDLLGAKRENRADEQFGLQETRVRQHGERSNAALERQNEYLALAQARQEETERANMEREERSSSQEKRLADTFGMLYGEGSIDRVEDEAEARARASAKYREPDKPEKPILKTYMSGDSDIDRMVENLAEEYKESRGKYPPFAETKKWAENYRANPLLIVREGKKSGGGKLPWEQ